MEFKYRGHPKYIPEIIRALKDSGWNFGDSDVDFDRMKAGQIMAAQRKPMEEIGNSLRRIAESLVVERNLAGEINGSGV